MDQHAIQVLRADGSKEQTTIWSNETRISAEGFIFRASHEGVSIRLGPGVVPLPLGAFAPDEVVPWDTELMIGDTRVRIGEPREHTPPPGGAPVRPKQKTSPVVVICGALSVAVLAWLVLGVTEERGLRAPPPAPELWGEAEPCPTAPSQPNAALLAERAERGARAMMQRYPFAPADGVAAVGGYRRAAACWRSAGFEASAAAADAQAVRGKRRVDEDYGTTRFLLFRALETGHTGEARAQVAHLSELLGDRSGPYVDWLREIDRALAARAGAEERRR